MISRRGVRLALRALSAAAGLAIAMPAPARADQLVIVAGPSDGREALRTETLANAAAEAIAAINAAGGVNGEHLTLQRVDDGCERVKAAAAASEVAARKPALILGHPCAPAALAAADVYGKAEMLFIATATRAPALTAKRAGPTIFRLAGRDDAQGETAGRLLARAAPGAAVAIVHDRSRYGRDLADGAAAAYKRERGAPPITATIIGGDKDYRLTIAKVKNAAIVFFAGFPLEGGLVYKSLRAAGSQAEFIGADSFATDEFATTFGTDAKGVRALVSSAAWPGLVPQPGASGPTRADADPAFEGLRIKAAVAVFAAAAAKAESNEPAKVAGELARGVFTSPLGPVSFSAEGDARIPSYQLVEWRGDEWSPPSAAPSQ